VIITRRYELDAGHCLPTHEGKCYRPHGHRYAVEAMVSGDVIEGGSSDGMVLDFARLGALMAEVLDPFDHRFMMSRHDARLTGAVALFADGLLVTEHAPTAENLAMLWTRELIGKVGEAGWVEQVTVYETPKCAAIVVNNRP